MLTFKGTFKDPEETKPESSESGFMNRGEKKAFLLRAGVLPGPFNTDSHELSLAVRARAETSPLPLQARSKTGRIIS
jgi:hypothetical protein